MYGNMEPPSSPPEPDGIDETELECPCGFEGDVEVAWWGQERVWTCPNCNTTHADDMAEALAEEDADRRRQEQKEDGRWG